MKRFALILCMLLVVSMTSVTAFASGVDTGIAGDVGSNNPYGLDETVTPDALMDVDNVTVDDLGEKLDNMGQDVVYLFKLVGRYVCLAIFIVCCILMLVGVLGNPRLLWKALIGAVISGLAYAGITCGEQVVNLIASWAAS